MASAKTIKTTLMVLHRYTSAALFLLLAVFVSGVALAYRVELYARDLYGGLQWVLGDPRSAELSLCLRF